MADKWRFIDAGNDTAYYNMAMDEAIASAVKKGYSPPTLRLYGWDRPSVSIGYFQSIGDIDYEYCVKKGIPIVRRPTGGRAILHDSEITYSFSVRSTGIFSKGLLDSYEKISKAFCLALSKIGLASELKLRRASHRNSNPLCFQTTSYGEITVNNRKVIGSAQKRWPDGLLQQGSIPFALDEGEIVNVFRLKSSEIVEKLTGLKNVFPYLSIDSLKSAIRVSFEEIFNIRLVLSFPSQEEISLAEEIEANKYLSPLWNFQR